MNNKMNNFPGIFIPREIILNENLSSTDKLIYGVVQSLDNEKGCYATNHYIGEVAGVGHETVRASIAKMESLGLIVRYFIESLVNKPGEVSRTIKTASTIALTPPNNSWGTPQNPQGTPPRKSGVYNTSNDNSNKYKDEDVDISVPHGEKFKESWAKWVEYRREKRKPLTRMTIELQLSVCKANSEQACIDSINKSIERGWIGLFFDDNKNTRKPLTSQDHNAF